MRAFRTFSLLVVVLASIAAIGNRGATAKETTHFRETYADDFSFPSCDGSFTITGHVEGRYSENVWADPGAGVDALGDPIITRVDHHDAGKGTWTNLANGKSLSFSFSDHFNETVVSYNGGVAYPGADDGVAASYTLNWRERGIPIKIKKPTGGVISIDAGLIVTPDVEFLIYRVGGEYQIDIPATGEPVVHGPHPLFGTDRFCEITDQYLA